MREQIEIPMSSSTIQQEAGPETARAIALISERVIAGLQGDGSTNRDIKGDVGVQGEDGRKEIGGIADIHHEETTDDAPQNWNTVGDSAVLVSGRAYNATAATPDGRYYMGIRDKPSTSDGLFEVFRIGDDDLVIPEIIGTIDSAVLDAPDTQRIVVNQAGDKCAVITTDSGDANTKLSIISLSDKTSPAILGSLTLSGTVPATGTQAVWDDDRKRIFWPLKNASDHVAVYDVSNPASPTVASTYTTSGLTNCIAAVFSESHDWLYLCGDGGVESVSIAFDGSLTLDTTVLVANEWQTLDQNGSLVTTLIKSSNSVVNVWSLDIAVADEGAISTNTNDAVSGSYTNAGDFRNATLEGDFLACTSGIPGTSGLFLVFNVSDPTSVTEQSSVALSTPDGNSEIAMGGPRSRKYIQLGLDADVETWRMENSKTMRPTADQFVSTAKTRPPMVVCSQDKVANFNADLLDYKDSTDFVGVGQSIILPVTTVTGATTLGAHETVVICDATSAAFSVTLPAAADQIGRRYFIKKVDVSANAVTIDGNASETIDDTTTRVLSLQYDAAHIVSDGTEWWII